MPSSTDEEGSYFSPKAGNGCLSHQGYCSWPPNFFSIWLLLFHAVDDDPSRGKNGWEETWTNRYTAATEPALAVHA